MLTIPNRLEDWNLEVIKGLLEHRIAESDSFDFKETLPIKAPDEQKLRLRKTLCAFANADGGFLIYGVHDDRTLNEQERLIGIDVTVDFPNIFSHLASTCMPSISWRMLPTPIPLKEDKVIHVVEVLKSWQAPHAVALQKDAPLQFVKRVPGGTAYMSLEEIRNAMLNYHERRLKLELLRGELQNFVREANFKRALQPLAGGIAYRTPIFDVGVVKSILPEIYILLRNSGKTITNVNEIRAQIELLSLFQNRLFHAQIQEFMHGNAIQKHNNRVDEILETIGRLSQDSIEELNQILGA